MGSMFGLSASTAPPSPPDANSSALSSRDPTRFESPSYPLQRKSSPLSGSHPATNDRAGQWEGFGGKTRRVIALGETHGDRWYLMFASFGFEPGTPGMGTGGQTRPPLGGILSRRGGQLHHRRSAIMTSVNVVARADGWLAIRPGRACRYRPPRA